MPLTAHEVGRLRLGTKSVRTHSQRGFAVVQSILLVALAATIVLGVKAYVIGDAGVLRGTEVSVIRLIGGLGTSSDSSLGYAGGNAGGIGIVIPDDSMDSPSTEPADDSPKKNAAAIELADRFNEIDANPMLTSDQKLAMKVVEFSRVFATAAFHNPDTVTGLLNDSLTDFLSDKTKDIFWKEYYRIQQEKLAQDWRSDFYYAEMLDRIGQLGPALLRHVKDLPPTSIWEAAVQEALQQARQEALRRSNAK